MVVAIVAKDSTHHARHLTQSATRPSVLDNQSDEEAVTALTPPVIQKTGLRALPAMSVFFSYYAPVYYSPKSLTSFEEAQTHPSQLMLDS